MSRLTRNLRRLALASSLFVIGALAGPVVISAGMAWFFPQKNGLTGDSEEAFLLYQAYRARRGSDPLFISMPSPDDGRECGYDPAVVFPDGPAKMVEARQHRQYVDYTGYSALDRWRQDMRDDQYHWALTAHIDEKTTDFEAGFLRRCIESTLLAPYCMERVSRFDDDLETGNLVAFDPWLNGHQDEVVCTFVDGVAARAGIPLVTERPAPPETVPWGDIVAVGNKVKAP